MAILGKLSGSFQINQNMVNTDTKNCDASAFFNCSLYWNWVNSYCSNLLKNNRFWTLSWVNFLLPLCKAYPKLINSYQCQALAFLGNASVNHSLSVRFCSQVAFSNTTNEITDEERQISFLCKINIMFERNVLEICMKHSAHMKKDCLNGGCS